MIKPFKEKLAFVEIASEDELCHPEFGDEQLSWKENGYAFRKINDRFFVALDRDKNGNFVEDLTISKLFEWSELLNGRAILGKEDLPEPTIEETIE